MYRFIASTIVLVAVAVCWFLFGDHTPTNDQSSHTSSQEQSSQSADDEALRKSLSGK